MKEINFEKLDIRDVPLNKRLPEELSSAIHQTVGYASLAWNPAPTGNFDLDRAGKADLNLCQFIADYLEQKVNNDPTNRND